MSIYRLLLLLLPTLLCGNVPAQKEESRSGDSAPVVIMAPGGPVIANLRITVDRRPYRLWVATFMAKRADSNRDGSLGLDEVSLIPDRLIRQAGARSPQHLLRLATGQNEADSVDAVKFSEWLASALGQGVNVIAGAVQASEAVRLAGLIDSNGDGAVTREEVQSGRHSMRFRDLDDDQTFSAAELLPYRDPRTQQAAVVPEVARLPFVQLGDNEAVQRCVQQILERYGDGQTIIGARARQPAITAESLNADALTGLLVDPVFHLEVNIELPDRRRTGSLEFKIPDAAKGFCRVTPGRTGRARLIVDDMPIEIRARGGGQNTRTFLVSFLMQRFSVYDEDKNSYLTEDEFPQMQSQFAQQNVRAQFADVDLNNDEMLVREELALFLERDAIATQSQIEASIRQDGKTFFKLLDENTDRRLTQREFLEGFDRLLEYDINNDERITEAELGTAYALEIGLGQLSELRTSRMMQDQGMQGTTNAVLPGLANLEGPEWFKRMDRNQDRDVSRREFLGPRETFQELDTNKDGLLSREEAEAL